ncbi:hypothetical protein HOO68_05365 [Candidatus Gracilibacteria bacterium]|nr:hypothetical protein [Candidatus Gracilibacteria bacterium]
MPGIIHIHSNIESGANPHNLPEARQRLHRVRGVFLAIFEGDGSYLRKEEVAVAEDARNSLEKISGDGDIHTMKSSKQIKDIIKKASKDVLSTLGINHNDAPTKSLHTLAVRYKKMTVEKFITRYENEKIQRDIRFIMYVLHFYGQQGYNGIKGILKISKNGSQVYTKLRHDSPAIEAMSSIFDRIRVFMNESNSPINSSHMDTLYAYSKKIAKTYKEPKSIQK